MAATTDFWPVGPGWSVSVTYQQKKADGTQSTCHMTLSMVGWIQVYSDGLDQFVIEPAVFYDQCVYPVTSCVPSRYIDEITIDHY